MHGPEDCLSTLKITTKQRDMLNEKMDEKSRRKLTNIKNHSLHEFLATYVELCNPDRVMVLSDSPEDIKYIREKAIEDGEEARLATEGHTVHFDNYCDQARDRENTLVLVPEGIKLSYVRTGSREEKLREIHELMKDVMRGHTMYVCFYSLGPLDSIFTIPCVQITDSSYVVHNENLFYRQGYREFVEKPGLEFLKFIHSSGELDDRKCSKNLDKRRIYIDIEGNTVYSVNTQYGGNSIGLKKLAMRLTIYKSSREGWLTEHMLIMGIHGPNNRVTYFAGAFPSLCGKTSTSMLEGETIIGDDIAFLRKRRGEVRGANVEIGIFGILEGINSQDEPLLYQVLTSPGEIIFSNVLVTEDGFVYWVGKDGPVPRRGYNYSGEWWPGKRDREGRVVPPSHPNARFSLNMKLLPNLDPRYDDPEGVKIDAIVYGGRDSDTWVPVEEAFDWEHGIITKGASLESERTAAVLRLGDECIREFNPMSNLDFLSISIGKYIRNYLEFGKGLSRTPLIFSLNYFLRDKDGRFLNEKRDKKVWFKWMELRVHHEVEAIEVPTGWIPKYEDLKKLFEKHLNKTYSEGDYVKQFTLRIPEQLAKIDRIVKIYRSIPDTPSRLFEVLEDQRMRLLGAKEKLGDYVSPFKFL
jgi:phosphoenolpyruvate carboxykinase (GTP)